MPRPHAPRTGSDAPAAGLTQGDELVERSVGGDRQALVELLEFVGPRIRGGLHIDPVWRASVDADDVMQTTYLEVFLRIDQLELRTVAAFRRWVGTMAENNLRDAVKALTRAKRPDPRRQVAGEGRAPAGTRGDSTVALLDQLGAISHTASRDAIAREAERLLRDALEQLPSSYRHVVQRVDLDVTAVETVARELERSPGAVYMLRARAHDRLREILGPSSRMLGSRG